MVLTLQMLQATEVMQESRAFADEWVRASSSAAASSGIGYRASEQVSLLRRLHECDSAIMALQCTT